MLAFFTQYNLLEVLHQPILRSFSVNLTMLCNIIIVCILRKYIRRGWEPLKEMESEEFQLFSEFITLCTFFVLLDSISCLFEISDKLIALFLVGGNVLLIFMILIFGRYAYTLYHDAYIKEEYRYLKEQEHKQRHQVQQWEEQAYRDRLTHAYTRRYIINNLRTMLQEKEEFSLVFLDLDDFKQINDVQGHISGDEVLRKFSSYMKKQLRPRDIFARYGGDEFLILMPELQEDACRTIMERCQKHARMCTFSYGVIQIVQNNDASAEELITQADRRMYEYKQQLKKVGDSSCIQHS